MARPLRLEFAGALYHVTSRGDRREDIYLDDDDRRSWLAVLGTVCGRFNWVVHAYCQMSNHYHLLVETPDGNLSRGMRQLNGLYTQGFNRKHGLVGHLFQGRYKAILVQKEGYLLELSRYVVLNPVRARIVDDPAEWPWSSLRAVLGGCDVPAWLDTDWLLSHFAPHRQRARRAFLQFVMDGVGRPSPLEHVQHQILLGDSAFVAKIHDVKPSDDLREVSKAHRRSIAKPLAYYQSTYVDRDAAMAEAYASGAYTMKEIGEFFGVHYMTVSRAVRRLEGRPRSSGKEKRPE
jgi:REP element-mobilizing transposase RayT